MFYAWDESLFSDRVHQERVQRLTEGGKLLVCDEASPSNLPMSRWFFISELAVLLERWRLIEQRYLYLFLKKLNGELANATTSADFFDAVLPVANLPEDRFQEWNTLLGLLPIACILKDDGIAGVEWDSKVTREVEAPRVFDRECQARLMQAILRLRQMVNLDKIAVVFSSEPIGGLPIARSPLL